MEIKKYSVLEIKNFIGKIIPDKETGNLYILSTKGYKIYKTLNSGFFIDVIFFNSTSDVLVKNGFLYLENVNLNRKRKIVGEFTYRNNVIFVGFPKPIISDDNY